MGIKMTIPTKELQNGNKLTIHIFWHYVNPFSRKNQVSKAKKESPGLDVPHFYPMEKRPGAGAGP